MGFVVGVGCLWWWCFWQEWWFCDVLVVEDWYFVGFLQ